MFLPWCWAVLRWQIRPRLLLAIVSGVVYISLKPIQAVFYFLSCRQNCEVLYSDSWRQSCAPQELYVYKDFPHELLRRIRPHNYLFWNEDISYLTYTRAPPAPRRLMSMPPRARGLNAPAPYTARTLESGRQEKARYCARLPRSTALPIQHIALPQSRGPLSG